MAGVRQTNRLLLLLLLLLLPAQQRWIGAAAGLADLVSQYVPTQRVAVRSPVS